MRKKIALHLVLLLVFLSIPFKWGYAEETPESPAILMKTPTFVSSDTTSATFQVKVNQAVDIYYVVTGTDGATPDATQVLNGQDSENGIPEVAGSQAGVAADTYTNVTIDGLTPENSYRVFFVAKNSSSKVSSVRTISNFSTQADTDPPNFTTETPTLEVTNIDGASVNVQINETGTVYYAIYNHGVANIRAIDVVAGNYAIFCSSIPIDTPYTNYEIPITGLDAFTAYDVYFVGEDESLNQMASPSLVEILTLGVEVTGLEYNNGLLATDTDDAFKLIFDNNITNVGSDSDYTIELDHNSGGGFVDADITLVPTTDYIVSGSDDDTVTLTLASTGLAKIDEVSEFDNGNVKITVVNPQNLEPNIDSSCVDFVMSLDNSIIKQEDVKAVLGNIKYDVGVAADFGDDKLLLTFDQDISQIGSVDDYLIEVDNHSEGKFTSADFTFNSSNYEVLKVNEITVEISFTDSVQALLEDTVNATIKVTIKNCNNLIPAIDPTNNMATVSKPNHLSKLSNLKINSLTVDGFDQDTYEYTQVISYNDYKNLNGMFETIVAATALDSNAIIKQSTSGLNHQVIVTSEDGWNTSVYNIQFVVDKYAITSYLDEKLITSPNHKTKNVIIQLDKGTSTIPTLRVQPQHPDATVNIVGSGSLPGTYVYTIVVTIDGAGVETYTLTLAADSASSGSSGSSKKHKSSSKSKESKNTTVDDVLDVVDTTNPTAMIDDLTDYIDTITGQVDDITDEADVETAINNSLQTLELIQALETIESTETTLTDLIEQDANNLEEIIEKTDDDTLKTQAVTNYLDNLNQVYTETTLERTVDLDNTVERLIERVIEDVGEVEVVKDFEVVDEKAILDVDSQDIVDQVETIAKQVKTLEDSYNSYFDETGIRTFEEVVTLKVEEPEGVDTVEVVMKPDVLDFLREQGIDSTGVEVGSAALTFNQESDLFKSEETLSFQFDFEKQDTSIPQVPTGSNNQSEPPAGYIDVNVSIGNTAANEYNKPVELSFDLDNFEFFTDEPPTNSLAIYRFDEETQIWEPVGGIYDPVTNTITARRIHLSKYTVMQSTKAFNDVDNSWAKDEINELLGKGIIEETESFHGENNVTRGEFISWISKSYGLDDDNATTDFKDVDKSHPYYNEICNAQNQGLVVGKGDGRFDPDGYVTHEEMAKILSNVLVRFENKKRNDNFQTKISKHLITKGISDWAADDIALVSELGIFNNNGLDFKPNTFVTKEAAAFAVFKLQN